LKFVVVTSNKGVIRTDIISHDDDDDDDDFGSLTLSALLVQSLAGEITHLTVLFTTIFHVL
jgi:hypothetical protein